MIKDMRHELLRLIVESEVDDGEILGLSQLSKIESHFIPGLIDCLADSDWLIRRHAIQILGNSRPESDAALPALIASLDDENETVRETALSVLPVSARWLSTQFRISKTGTKSRMRRWHYGHRFSSSNWIRHELTP